MAEEQFGGISNAILDVQPGGAGYPWLTVEEQHGIESPSGGGVSANRRWGHDIRGGIKYLGKEISSNPNPFTTTVTIARSLKQVIEGLVEEKRGYYTPTTTRRKDFNARVRYKPDGNFEILNEFDTVDVYVDAVLTSLGGTAPPKVASATDGAAPERRDTLALDAGVLDSLGQLGVKEVTSGQSHIAGHEAATVLNDGTEIIVTENVLDTTQKTFIGYKRPDETTFTWQEINTFTTAGQHATDVIAFGDILIVTALLTPFVTWATIDDVLNQVATPWTAGSGIATNAPNAMARMSSNKVLAVGAAGYVWETSDGKTWTELDAGVTTANALNDIQKVDTRTAWIGGASGTLVKYSNGNLSIVTVSGLSDAITTIAVPPGRPNHLNFGTDAGDIYQSYDVLINGINPTFTVVDSGFNNIAKLAFAGAMGHTLWVVTTAAGGASTIRRDLSGGNCGKSLQAITTPTNNGLNDLVPLDNGNIALAVGEIQTTNGAIMYATWEK